MRLSPDYRAGLTAGHLWGSTAQVRELHVVSRLQAATANGHGALRPLQRRLSEALLDSLQRLLTEDRASFDAAPLLAAAGKGELFCRGFLDGAVALAKVRI